MTDLQGRLDKLQLLLGQGVKLVDKPESDEHANTDTLKDFLGNGPDNSFGVVMSDDLIFEEEKRILAEKKQPAQEQQHDTAYSARERQLAANKEKALDCSKFRIGEPLDKDFKFCPLKVMVSYPDRFIGKVNKPRAKPYFTRILFERTWDFFYLHDPTEPGRDPYLLVPSAQFEVFLEELNLELDTSLRIPSGLNTDKFFMKFGEGDTPRPRYLRRSQEETSLDIRPWPIINPDDINAFQAAPPRDQLIWRSKMRVVKSGFVPKKGGDPEKAAKKKRHRDQMLRNTLGYLGLHGDPDGHDVVFICVDVEAIERKPNPISEIGFAILDTRDIKGVDPKSVGRGWWPMIKTYHLRVYEYAGLRNHQFVKGCPDNFNFGESTFPPKDNIGEAIMAILDPYLLDERNIVIVGHDVKQDINYFGTLGIDLRVLAELAEPIDTQEIHQAWCDSTQGRGLSVVLNDLGISSKNLHNAGNDAHYTLCAMLGVVLEHVREQEEQSNEMLNSID
ncbi:hypothetical protein NW762_002780 [Fusarium torreyae]|uniref:Gfd2/YDR514C-like C-terminal domain-containing protein n=1 Tax=Fusarium torreyae TaxID=1237075 RepID=A0A9W8SDK6_9HYPO|nr:hypothetical protein NW762_002780 [Fusarium torreyae]